MIPQQSGKVPLHCTLVAPLLAGPAASDAAAHTCVWVAAWCIGGAVAMLDGSAALRSGSPEEGPR